MDLVEPEVGPQQPVDGAQRGERESRDDADDPLGTDGPDLLGLHVRRLPQARVRGFNLDVAGPAEAGPGHRQDSDQADLGEAVVRDDESGPAETGLMTNRLAEVHDDNVASQRQRGHFSVRVASTATARSQSAISR